MKSEIMKQIAEQTGLPLIDIKLSEVKHSDFIGRDISLKGAINETIEGIVEEKIASREIQIGDGVLMEYAEGVIELVLVQAIEDGLVYGEGDDGEPYCAPIANCDKVPF